MNWKEWALWLLYLAGLAVGFMLIIPWVFKFSDLYFKWVLGGS